MASVVLSMPTSYVHARSQHRGALLTANTPHNQLCHIRVAATYTSGLLLHTGLCGATYQLVGVHSCYQHAHCYAEQYLTQPVH
jgi:hypothetical protein